MKGQALYQDALSDLTAAYEDEHYAIEPASDADMLRHLMSAKAVSQAEINQATGIPKIEHLRGAGREEAV
jgi:antitoxin component HigA of HigAB toxin-antitoxin module